MKTETGNHLEDIHVVNYREKFEKYRIGAETLVATDGRNLESLDGKWTFMADPYESALRADWYKEIRFSPDGREVPYDFDFELWPEMKVPSCWNMERSDLYLYDDLGLYYRPFTYRPEKEGERTFIQFEGAQYRTYVFINNKPVAMHDGGSTPFTVETTGLLNEFNKIMVFVDASRNRSRVPMDNTDWFNYGGLYRSVNFFRTGKSLIKDWFIRLLPKSDFKKIALDFTVDGKTEGFVCLEIPELGIRKDVPFSNGKGSIVFDAALELWSPECPKLYDVSLSIDGDRIEDRIGFREIRVDGKKILLNGKRIFLKGISVHEDHIELGKTSNDDVIRKTISDLKELNGCFLRLAHYPHTRRFAKIADELGVLLWEEIPVYWAIDFDNPSTFADASNQLSELILRDRNRASVIIWSIGNENEDTDSRLSFMSRLAKRAREIDDSRLVSAACLVNTVNMRLEDRLMDCLDIIGNNQYYGWYEPNFDNLITILNNTQLSKPVIITEFGGGARYGIRGTKDTRWTEDYQAELYRKQYETMLKSDFIQGTTPWILYDFRAVRRLNHFQEGFNRKGLIDADRVHRKLAFDVVKNVYKNL